jgi:hypothetical protein
MRLKDANNIQPIYNVSIVVDESGVIEKIAKAEEIEQLYPNQ